MRTAELRPTVVVLDDLHWADKAAVHLLGYVLGVAEPMRLLVVGASRPDDLGVGHVLTEAFAPLQHERGVEFVELRGLDDLELLDLMSELAGPDVGDDARITRRDRLRDRRQPVLLHGDRAPSPRNRSDHRTGRGEPDRDRGHRVGTAGERAPSGRRTCSRLGPETERLLRAAAVIGRDFGLGLLAAVTDTDEDAVLDVLDRAVTAALVHNVGTDEYSSLTRWWSTRCTRT